jgi:hypothetical protein
MVDNGNDLDNGNDRLEVSLLFVAAAGTCLA